MMFWLGGHEDKEDRSFADSIDRMAAALAAIGLPQGTTAEFTADVDAMLESGMPPDQWRAGRLSTGEPPENSLPSAPQSPTFGRCRQPGSLPARSHGWRAHGRWWPAISAFTCAAGGW